jgi:hypothetical protein
MRHGILIDLIFHQLPCFDLHPQSTATHELALQTENSTLVKRKLITEVYKYV